MFQSCNVKTFSAAFNIRADVKKKKLSKLQRFIPSMPALSPCEVVDASEFPRDQSKEPSAKEIIRRRAIELQTNIVCARPFQKRSIRELITLRI